MLFLLEAVPTATRIAGGPTLESVCPRPPEREACSHYGSAPARVRTRRTRARRSHPGFAGGCCPGILWLEGRTARRWRPRQAVRDVSGHSHGRKPDLRIARRRPGDLPCRLPQSPVALFAAIQSSGRGPSRSSTARRAAAASSGPRGRPRCDGCARCSDAAAPPPDAATPPLDPAAQRSLTRKGPEGPDLEWRTPFPPYGSFAVRRRAPAAPLPSGLMRGILMDTLNSVVTIYG